jgi:branched-chain amino acid transport system substrate-binding protein
MSNFRTTNAKTAFRVSRRGLGRLAAGTALGLAMPPTIGRAEPATLRIPNIQAITGPSSAYGWRARDGAQLMADDINAAGLSIGGTTYRIELHAEDMANDPQQAITLLRQAASNPDIVAVIGPSNSVGFVPSVPAAGQLEIPLVGAGPGAPLKQWNIWSYRVNPVSETATPAMLRKVHAQIDFKRLAVIYDQTQDGQAGDAQACKVLAQELGYEVTAFEAFRAGDQDFSAQLATIRSRKPDAIYVAAATGDGVKVASQVRDAGFTVPMITGYGSFQDPVYWDGTRGEINGCYTWLAQDFNSPPPPVKSFIDRYKAKFPQEATSYSLYGADAVFTAVEALKKAGAPTRAKIQEALAEMEVVSPLGAHITFHNPPSGNNNTPSVVAIKVTGRGSYVAI